MDNSRTLGIERVRPFISEFETLTSFALRVVIRFARVDAKTKNLSAEKLVVGDGDTTIRIACLGGHYFVDEELEAPIYKSAVLRAQNDAFARGLIDEVVGGDGGGELVGETTDLARSYRPARERETPVADTYKLVSWLLSDQARAAGATRNFSGLFEATQIHSVPEAGTIPDDVLADDALLARMCRPVISAHKGARRDPTATYVIDFETTGAGTQVDYMCQWVRLEEAAGADAAAVSHGAASGKAFFEAVLRDHALSHEELQRLHLSPKQQTMKRAHPNRVYTPSFRPNKAPTHVVAYAHNSGFDCAFIVAAAKACGFVVYSRLVNGGKPVSITLVHAAAFTVIELRDSYRVLMEPVSALGKTWNLQDAEKELVIHDAITADLLGADGSLTNAFGEDVLRARVSALNALPQNKCAPRDAGEWVAKFDSLGLRNGGVDRSLRLRDYIERYGRLDVVIVARALLAFDAMMSELASRLAIVNEAYLVRPSNSYSAAAIADGLYKACGAFDGVYELTGPLLLYLQGHVVGGRCQLSLESGGLPFEVATKQEIVDAVSLYPSAQNELESYPAGVARGLLPLSEGEDAWRLLEATSGPLVTAWFADLSMRADARAPLDLSLGMVGRRGGSGEAISWVNDLRDGSAVKFNNVSFESFCRVHGYTPDDFVFHRAVFFQARSEKEKAAGAGALKTTVAGLFNLRLDAKAAGNAGLDACTKLMLNSAYGRLLLKWSDEAEDLCEAAALPAKINRLGGRAIRWSNVTSEADESQRTYSVVSRTGIAKAWGRYHCGALVLAKSREIMDRVVHAATVCEPRVEINYTDTDSLHLAHDRVDALACRYAELYPQCPPMLGKGLGQLHGDIELKVAGKKRPAWSNAAVYLGKKSYCHAVEAAGGERGHKFSMKGISGAAVALEADARGDVWAVFTDLFRGDSIKFDNRAAGKVRFSMIGRKNSPCFEIEKLPALQREVCFRSA